MKIIGAERGAFSLAGVMVAATVVTVGYVAMNAGIGQDLQVLAKLEHSSRIDSIEHSVMADVFRRMGSLAEELGMGLCTMTHFGELSTKLQNQFGSDRYQLELVNGSTYIGRLPQSIRDRCQMSSVQRVASLDPGTGGGQPAMINICAERGLYACFVVRASGNESQPFLSENDVVVEMRYFLQDLDSGDEVDFAAFNDTATKNRQGFTYYSIHFANRTSLSLRPQASTRSGILRGRSRPAETVAP